MRVVIAEDSVLLREGLVRVLGGAGIDVVAAVGDAEELLRALAEHHPDLAIVDVRMPPSFTDEGIRAALTAKRQWPDLAVLVLSQYVEERYATELLAQAKGKVGYLLKDRVADVGEFIEAMERVAAGGTALDPEVISQLLIRRASSPLQKLTEREREVLRLISEGRSNAGVAASLFVSESAVAKHVNSIFTKLDLAADSDDHRRVLAVLRFLEGDAS